MIKVIFIGSFLNTKTDRCWCFILLLNINNRIFLFNPRSFFTSCVSLEKKKISYTEIVSPTTRNCSTGFMLSKINYEK